MVGEIYLKKPIEKKKDYREGVDDSRLGQRKTHDLTAQSHHSSSL